MAERKKITQTQYRDRANAYLDKTVEDLLTGLGYMAKQAELNEDTNSTKSKVSIGVHNTITAMVNKLKAINGDGTKTRDHAILLQAEVLENGIKTANSQISIGLGDINTLINQQTSRLYSRSVDESPRALAMLGNTELLKEIRTDYTKFVNNPISASAVNAFNKYGLLGGKELSESIDKRLNKIYTPDTVKNIDGLDNQKKALVSIQRKLKSASHLLSTDADKLAGIRASVVNAEHQKATTY